MSQRASLTQRTQGRVSIKGKEWHTKKPGWLRHWSLVRKPIPEPTSVPLWSQNGHQAGLELHGGAEPVLGQTSMGLHLHRQDSGEQERDTTSTPSRS